jgi:glycosyltransferase involved in cell wall biosynthesis
VTRIGLVVHGQPPELVGGTEQLVASLARDLHGAGETVEVFSGSMEWRPRFEVVRLEDGPVPVVRVHRQDLFFERWDRLESPFVERAYGEWLAAYRPDLVHVHHWARLTSRLVRVAAHRGIPAVASLHDLFPSCPRYHRVMEDGTFCTAPAGPGPCTGCAPRWRFQGDAEIAASVSRFVEGMSAELQAAAALLAPTEGHGRRVAAWLGRPLQVAALPPAGGSVPAPATRPLGDRAAGAGDPLRVGVFGHLHPLKGIEVVLAALEALPERALVELHVWGEAPDEASRDALAARAASLPVVWHGAYRPEDLAGAPVDAVVLPTLCAESYSFTLDEAAALAVPVLATDLGALADRATARLQLFPRGEASALAQELLRLAREPARRAAMAAAPAPATVAAAAHLAKLREVYARVLAAPRPTPRPSDPEELALREHAALLRDAALQELLRSEGWEDVVARLSAENEALRQAAGGD